ncbi:MAG: 3-isopropylmalate dehydrogenase [Candidatus Neomarinimicrobiota bacterium]
MRTVKLAILPGDGIGPEVMNVALKVLTAVGDLNGIRFATTTALVGGCSIEQFGVPLTDAALQICQESDAVLLGAVGGPQWDDLPQQQKPEAGLLKLRSALGLFSNLRPARIYPALAQASSLKKEVLTGVDILVVRELTGGIYFGQPRGLDTERGWNTLVYTRLEVERIARVACELAGKRRGRVTSVHKANVLESSQFWRSIVREVARDYPQVELTDMYVDNAAMQLVRDPRQFDVIVTQNMFGDILSDIAAMITGSLGMLPSASLGTKYALYEPVHGSAPEIAGKNQANPLAMIGSLVMLLDYSLHLKQAADQLQSAIEAVLDAGYRTADIAGGTSTVVSTSRMGDHLIDQLQAVRAPAPTD